MSEMMNKCYECIHRGTIPGDAHSRCRHPQVEKMLLDSFTIVENPLGVTGNAHGIKSGWFFWPFNFDPVWLLSCNGFEEKEKL